MFSVIVDATMGVVTSPIFVQFGLIGLFLNGVLSSVTPFPTEVTTTALILAGHDHFVIFLVLSVASITGGYLGYYVGYGGNSFTRRLFPKKSEISKDWKLLRKHRWLALVLSSWIPVIGDLIPMAAGAKHYSLRKFTLAISIGKVSKSAAVVYLSGILLPHFFPL